MTKSLIALIFACVCGMLAVAVPEVAQSQSVTIQGCSSPTFNTQTLTLSCGGGGSGPPSCTISGNANGTTGAVDNLTANCSPAATSWSWTGGSCAGQTGSTCAASESSSGSVAYRVTGSNASGTGSASPAFNVAWFSTSGAPQGCVITPANQSLGSAGGTINQLVATCAGGATPFTFAWARTGNCGGTSAMSSSATQGDSVPANTGAGSLSCTYTATVSNPSGSATPSATVTVAGKTSGIDCKSSAQGLPLGTGITGNTSTIQIPWVIDSANTLLTGNGTIAPQHSGMAVVGVIQVPPGAATSSNIGRIDIHEYGSTPIYRLATLSQTPCSWGNPLDPATFTSFQLDPNFYFTVGPNSSGYAQMQPGSTWYINVVMQNPTKVPPKGDTCGSADPCNFVIEFWKPNGT